MVSYEGLYERLKSRGITKTYLTEAIGISSRTIAKISKGEKVSQRTLQKIADYLECDAEFLCRSVSPNRILQTLRDEKEAKLSGGLYHELQVRMTYNSNHIEGSKLTEEQTRLIFETNTIDVGDGVPVDDILETVHHFRAIDYVIDMAEEALSEEIIKHLHYILKHDTRDSALSWFAVISAGPIWSVGVKRQNRRMSKNGCRRSWRNITQRKRSQLTMLLHCMQNLNISTLFRMETGEWAGLWH